ncbi:MAG TPA: glutamine amidotransferase, partial [Firmicutes bacterium]|nr:glutamine amidotransferase [Bacillota bacterium]
MTEFNLTICHLYPEHMDLYGDRGNVLALYQRAHWHGLNPTLTQASRGEEIDFTGIDIMVMGGLQESEQEVVVESLGEQLAEFKLAVNRGLVVLAISGSCQLLGERFPTGTGKSITGLGILDLYTEYKAGRFTGNAVTSCSLWDPPRNLAGFENHTGLTFLGPSVKPLGKVITGHGNNGLDQTEGAVYKNIIGSYLHGSLLPKNPWLTDYLLAQALAY